jgi:hypothetical protein
MKLKLNNKNFSALTYYNNNIFLFHQAVTRNKQGYNKHWSVIIITIIIIIDN